MNRCERVAEQHDAAEGDQQLQQGSDKGEIGFFSVSPIEEECLDLLCLNMPGRQGAGWPS